MKRKNADKNRGFSLIELIIAIAILVILTGLLAPQFLKYIERSRKAKCLNNQDVILTEYQVRLIEAEDIDTVEDAKELMEEVIAEIKAECPSGGKYEVKIVDDGKNKGIDTNSGWLELACTVHGGDGKGISSNPMIEEAQTAFEYMADFLKIETTKELAELEGWADINDKTYFNNDLFRKYLLSKKYSGTWPKFNGDKFSNSNFSNMNLYIQPYMNLPKAWEDNTEDSITVYASKASTADTSVNEPWKAYYIYYEGSWYQAPDTKSTIPVNGKNNSQIGEEIKQKGWTKMIEK